LVARGLCRSRGQANELIRAGAVQVDGTVVTKPSSRTSPQAVIDVEQSLARVVGRGAHKLAQALDDFGIGVEGRRALDAGACTGGFTQVLLDRGAAWVVAADVGHGQLAADLVADPRVHNEEGVNLRNLTPAWGWGEVDLVTADLSFISLTLVVPALASVISVQADLVLLVKPQFEAGRRALDSRGVVRSAADRATAVSRVAEAVAAQGLTCVNLAPCAIRGSQGNQEYFLHAVAGRPGAESVSVEHVVGVVVQDGTTGRPSGHPAAGAAKRT
jgi:23S rRNA (cytidine1920-2'-O)/16S rRNA (cytidine1409-2'-O)-methyltransferase